MTSEEYRSQGKGRVPEEEQSEEGKAGMGIPLKNHDQILYHFVS